MEIGILKTPIKHIYSEINKGKYKCTKHYLLDEVVYGNLLLTEKLNLSKNRGFAKSEPEYWLHTRPLKKWERLTGLFYNREFDIYLGDKGKNNQKEELIIVKFSDILGNIVVYYFKGYYTNDIKKVIYLIDQEPI
jgi:hypothetical protein